MGVTGSASMNSGHQLTHNKFKDVVIKVLFILIQFKKVHIIIQECLFNLMLTNIDKTQIWYGEFNLYFFIAPPPFIPSSNEFLTLSKY